MGLAQDGNRREYVNTQLVALSGAEVTLTNATGKTFTTHTTQEGKFTFNVYVEIIAFAKPSCVAFLDHAHAILLPARLVPPKKELFFVDHFRPNESTSSLRSKLLNFARPRLSRLHELRNRGCS